MNELHEETKEAQNQIETIKRIIARFDEELNKIYDECKCLDTVLISTPSFAFDEVLFHSCIVCKKTYRARVSEKEERNYWKEYLEDCDISNEEEILERIIKEGGFNINWVQWSFDES